MLHRRRRRCRRRLLRPPHQPADAAAAFADLLLRKLPFARLVKEVQRLHHQRLQVAGGGAARCRRAPEGYLLPVRGLELCAIHAKRVTIMPKDSWRNVAASPTPRPARACAAARADRLIALRRRGRAAGLSQRELRARAAPRRAASTLRTRGVSRWFASAWRVVAPRVRAATTDLRPVVRRRTKATPPLALATPATD